MYNIKLLTSRYFLQPVGGQFKATFDGLASTKNSQNSFNKSETGKLILSV